MKSSRSICYYWGGDTKRNLFVRSYGEFILIPPDREDRVTRNFGEIFWPIDGHGLFTMAGKEYVLRPGYVWYYPPGMQHDFKPKNTFHYCWLTIAGEDSGKLFAMLDIQPGLNRAGICPRDLFNRVGTDLNFLTKKHQLSALALAFKILTLIASGGRKMKASTGHDMGEVKNYIDANCGLPDLSVEQIASELNMHRVSLSRAFKKRYGVTISDYIISSRMKKASYLLSTTAYPLNEIAPECGMNSRHYFSKVFTQKIGFSPSEYRKLFRTEPSDGTIPS
ncbi:MAG: AraC family transcriptional regulator [Lentisphaerae bacterium]|jgi:AraC-like DNA-binding protein|nr:AraC family transcriptional regulator [Lentisphaerota bacterium]